MKAVIVYESMYGNTHLVADAIGNGLGDEAEVTVVSVGQADGATLAGADLIVVGGPTHVHGMPRPSTRKAAIADAQKSERGLNLDPGAEGAGLREWFQTLGRLSTKAAAFDTRIHGPALLTGRASKSIARQLRRHGCSMIAEPESFFVTSANRLLADEETRAREWGARLADNMARTA